MIITLLGKRSLPREDRPKYSDRRSDDETWKSSLSAWKLRQNANGIEHTRTPLNALISPIL